MARTILQYGASGAFKTSNAGQYAEFLYGRYGGITRGLFGDNYGPIREQIDSGLVEPWNLLTTEDPLACLLLAGQGYWPKTLKDGRCMDGLIKTEDWTGISGYLCEGFHENGTLIMRNLEKKQRSTGEPLVAEFGEVLKFAGFGDLKVQYAMSSRGTYGFVQNQTHRYFKLGLAGLPVPWVMVTTHEMRGKDKSGKVILGPSSVGKAQVEEIPEWFDHVLHFEQVLTNVALDPEAQKKAGAKTVLRTGTRAHFTKHKDAEVNVMWPAKLGVEPWLMEHIFSIWPNGYVPLINNKEGYVSSVRQLLELIDPAPEVVSAGETA